MTHEEIDQDTTNHLEQGGVIAIYDDKGNLIGVRTKDRTTMLGDPD